jgi:predicted nucleic acid-binding protein
VDAELETFLAYAALMDDGEAETIAAAELRHGGVVTDELRAWRVLQDHAPQVSRITSLGLIKQWGEANQIEGDILRTMLEGMRIRASYVPSQRQPHYAWYKKLFKIDKP